MFIHMSIHHPNPGYEQEVLDSMNRVRLAALGTPGLIQIGPWREEAGLAVTPAYFALRAQRLGQGDRADDVFLTSQVGRGDSTASPVADNT